MQTHKLPSSSALTMENELYQHVAEETVQDHAPEYWIIIQHMQTREKN